MRGWRGAAGSDRRRAGAEQSLAEFTGERVIPGQVDADLLNEHLARYAFAAPAGARQARARCRLRRRIRLGGTGRNRRSRWWAWIIAAEAVAFAREHYRLPQSAISRRRPCTALPHPDASFDLVVAFEVIEHLEDWREFLVEVRRVLAPSGPVHRLHAEQALLRGDRAAARAQSVSRARIRIRRSSAPSCRPSSRTSRCFWRITWRASSSSPCEAGGPAEVRVRRRRDAARGIALLRGRLRASAADRQSDLRLCAAHGQRAARARDAHRAARRRAATARTSGWKRPSRISRTLDQSCIGNCTAELEESNQWAADG